MTIDKATTGPAPTATQPTAATTTTEQNNTSTNVDPTQPTDDNATLQNQKYVEEFQYLLEKSQSLFSGLRDLPPTGSHRQWRPYFEKTFEVYTKLWKFQQAHRPLLEDKSNYGLKRWEVGEIASKIGQLYYHYYLRTSETNYLNEAYVFYEAIHDRQYFKNILEVKNPALMIKKMRYYARFIVVCLLLNKDENIRLLISELEQLIDEYTKTFKPLDAKEWLMVLQEITTFMEAEKKLVPINADRTQVPIQHRLPAMQVDKPQGLKLQEAILVGNYQNQIKFSELTLDMYRMLQSLEREPTLHSNKTAYREHHHQPLDHTTPANITPQHHDKSHPSGTSKRINPHKYLLYRPTFTQLLVYIATAFKDTGDNGVMLLYISADGCVNQSPHGFGFGGGISTSQRKPGINTTTNGTNTIINTSTACLYPADLIPFTRKPLFLIIDSNNSTAFQQTIPNLFDQPLMCLLSPTVYPSSIQDKSEIGSLFTLFLHTPLLGFCSVSDIGNLDQTKWDECIHKVTQLERMIGKLLLEDPDLDTNVKRFMTDDFLWTFIIRFVLCGIILRYHSSFKNEKSYPTSYPNIPEIIYTAPEIMTLFSELALIANVSTYFNIPVPTTTPASSVVGTSVNPASSAGPATSTTNVTTNPPGTSMINQQQQQEQQEQRSQEQQISGQHHSATHSSSNNAVPMDTI
ncbi:uncharacterized protein BX664DRAFT_259458 [Halteromyces radiatus]|uniref:uncharacterized protein n=1 Tax=Halteromyces radiatus TaxID=101107 RepID=UPI00221EA378|nr:uncharacterized protein BX664DRAFT_259458 [Halteromyces radiatus]KAI8093327.1 hypothetical protein BX664DRAFT_259458 [Halteromyces radiatus]